MSRIFLRIFGNREVSSSEFYLYIHLSKKLDMKIVHCCINENKHGARNKQTLTPTFHLNCSSACEQQLKKRKRCIEYNQLSSTHLNINRRREKWKYINQFIVCCNCCLSASSRHELSRTECDIQSLFLKKNPPGATFDLAVHQLCLLDASDFFLTEQTCVNYR